MMKNRWKKGSPTPKMVKEHRKKYGGHWVAVNENSYFKSLTFIRLATNELNVVQIQNGHSFWQDLHNCHWAQRTRYRPVDEDGFAVEWPGE